MIDLSRPFVVILAFNRNINVYSLFSETLVSALPIQ